MCKQCCRRGEKFNYLICTGKNVNGRQIYRGRQGEARGFDLVEMPAENIKGYYELMGATEIRKYARKPHGKYQIVGRFENKNRFIFISGLFQFVKKRCQRRKTKKDLNKDPIRLYFRIF